MNGSLDIKRRGKPYVFVSYRSLDVHLVRPVVELLIASGIPVWFAEYEILLANRSEFRQAFLSGARNAQKSIAFTRPEYWESEHTCEELRELLETETPVLDVRLRPSTLAAAASDEAKHLLGRLHAESCGVLDCQNPPEVATVLDFMSESYGLDVSQVEPNQATHSMPREFFLGRSDSFLLDIGDWAVVDARHRAELDIREYTPSFPRHPRWRIADSPPRYDEGIPASAGVDASILFQQRHQDSDLQLSVHPGPWTSNAFFDSVPLNDDRSTLDRMAEVASDYLAEDLPEAECFGAHLVLDGEEGHLAFSYSLEGGKFWARKYVIHAKPSNEEMELAFTFNLRGSLEEFLRVVHLADETVSSLAWNPTSTDLFGPRLPLVKLLYALPFFAAGLLFFLLVAWPIGLPSLAAVALSAIFGGGAGAALVPFVTKAARRISKTRRR